MNYSRLLFFLCFWLLYSPQLFSQNNSHKWSVGGAYVVTNMEGLFNQKALKPNNYTGGVKIFLGRYLSPSFNLRLEGSYGNLFYPKVSFYPERTLAVFTQQNFFDAAFLIEYKLNNNYLVKENSIIQPHVFIGFGTNNMNRDMNTYFPFGAGLKFKVTNWLALNLETTYKVNIDNSYSYLQHQAGLIFSFGKKGKSTIVENTNIEKATSDLKDLAILTSDYDKDGVDDASDECPYLFGTIAMSGCPDSDGDNVGDSRDKCPTEKGLLENGGCPIKTIDSDGDGVEDVNDKCPTEKGLMSNGGCPFVPEITTIKEEKKQIDSGKTLSNEMINIGVNTELFYLLSTSELNEKNIKTLDALAKYIVKMDIQKITIKGYTSTSGTDKINIDLAVARAQKVSNYLYSQGVNMRKMSVQGWGPYNPKYNNSLPEEAIKNQRVEIILE